MLHLCILEEYRKLETDTIYRLLKLYNIKIRAKFYQCSLTFVHNLFIIQVCTLIIIVILDFFF